MVWTIAKKEFHDNLFTFRFSFGSLILILLVLAITLASIKNYKDLNKEYMFSIQEAEKKLKENRVYSTIEYVAIKPPEILSILNIGVTNRLGNLVLISRMQVPYPEKKYAKENPLLNIFSSLDLTLAYNIVISLLAMLFTFDAISGEKDSGTLRLLLSQRVSRFKIILGKYLGNIFTLALSFLLSLFVVFTVIMVYFPNLGKENWLRIFVFALFTLLYISIFLIMGLALSSLTKKPSHTLISCLLLWIFLVIIVPNLSTYFATIIKYVPLEKSIEPKIKEIDDQTREKFNTWYELNRSPMTYSGGISGGGEGKVWLVSADQNAINYYKKYFSFTEPLYKKRADEIWKIKQDYYLLLKRQGKLAAFLNRISPTGLYQETVELISKTGVLNYERFIQQATLYRESIFNYFHSKDVFNSLRFFTVMEERDILPAEEYAKRSPWRKPDGSYYKIQDFSPLDLSDFPRFEYQKERMSDNLAGVISLFIVFIVINTVLFIGSAVAFNFYDVR
jgi:ABC-type transport system involved in multi-copper enzyme maturation permease subunit